MTWVHRTPISGGGGPEPLAQEVARQAGRGGAEPERGRDEENDDAESTKEGGAFASAARPAGQTRALPDMAPVWMADEPR